MVARVSGHEELGRGAISQMALHCTHRGHREVLPLPGLIFPTVNRSLSFLSAGYYLRTS